LIADTHALLWWWQDSPRLSSSAADALDDEANTILVSSVSIYEIGVKYRLGKVPEAAVVVDHFEELVRDSGFLELAVSLKHSRIAGLLPGPHRDPFDRILIAQAQAESAGIISIDRVFKSYDVATVW